jgi:hypothetical protein
VMPVNYAQIFGKKWMIPWSKSKNVKGKWTLSSSLPFKTVVLQDFMY